MTDNDRCYSFCHGCVFYDDGDTGYGNSCNIDSKNFEDRGDIYDKYDIKKFPCYDFRDVNDMWKMLEKDDGIKRV